MKKGPIIIILFLGLLTAASCASSRRTSVESQRRGLLMLEGENIPKNKGLYSAKKSKKRRKNNRRAGKKYYKNKRY